MNEEERQRYFDELALMFISPGWAHFMSTVQEFKQALTGQAFSFKTLEDLHFARGRMACFDQILGFQAMIEGLHQGTKDETEEQNA